MKTVAVPIDSQQTSNKRTAMATTARACHIALRFDRYAFCGGQCYNVIQEHNNIIKHDGQVALAKFGRRPSMSLVNILKEQIAARRQTRLYAVCRSDNGYECFSSKIENLVVGPDLDHQVSARAPQYYSHLKFERGLWIILSTPLIKARIGELYLHSNNRQLQDVLDECRTAMMLVTKQS
jgi:hypothetical protein